MSKLDYQIKYLQDHRKQCLEQNVTWYIIEAIDRAIELLEEDRDGRCMVLPCKVEQLKAQYDKLTEQMCDEAETYTTGYRNGHNNGQAEMIAYLLQLGIGTHAEADAALSEQEEHNEDD